MNSGMKQRYFSAFMVGFEKPTTHFTNPLQNMSEQLQPIDESTLLHYQVLIRFKNRLIVEIKKAYDTRHRLVGLD